MKYQFEIMHTLRKHVLDLLEGYSLAQLQHIPAGFSNNLIWNAAHIAVTQQLLYYRLSGLDCPLDDAFIDKFRKGTNAQNVEVSSDELVFIKEKLIELPKIAEQDYEKGIFKSYKSYPTSYQITLNSIEDAINFNNAHENLHLGYMMAMRKLIVK